jgi:anti-sigma B factor antagonist
MELSTRSAGPFTVVAVHRDADIASAGELRRQLHEVIDGGATLLMVDLSDTTFIDSAVLNALVAAHRRIRAADGRFAVLCPERRIRRPFEVTGLDKVFEMYAEAPF